VTAHTEFDTRALRDALGRWATGVTIVTAPDGDGFVGMTVNSFTSVSLDPPLVLWCIGLDAWSLDAFTEAEHFAVNVLAADQIELSNRFARRGEDKFADLDVEIGLGGTALLPGCVARLQCRNVDRHDAGDHAIVIGEVVAIEHADRQPLLFHAGRYGRFLPADR